MYLCIRMSLESTEYFGIEYLDSWTAKFQTFQLTESNGYFILRNYEHGFLQGILFHVGFIGMGWDWA